MRFDYMHHGSRRDIIYRCVAVRKRRKITQQQVAKETGYTQSNISAFEHMRCNNADLLAYYMNKFGDS